MDTTKNITITVNGVSENIQDGDTIEQYISTHDYDEHSLVVELNFKVIIKSNWPTTKISAGDNLMIFRYVGGG